MANHVQRRLAVLLVVGAVVFSIGMTLMCMVSLSTASWLFETEAEATKYWADKDHSDRWLATANQEVKLLDWGLPLLSIGGGTLSAAAIGLVWTSKGRFRLRSLFIAMTFLCFAIGLPYSQVWPRLRNPKFTYRAPLYICLEQHGAGDGDGSFCFVTPRGAMIAAAPLLVLPLIFYLPSVRRGSTKLP